MPNALLVQGTGADVYCVWRMVRLIDAQPNVEVVALEHAVAAELASGLQALVAGRRDAAPASEANQIVLAPRSVLR